MGSPKWKAVLVSDYCNEGRHIGWIWRIDIFDGDREICVIRPEKMYQGCLQAGFDEQQAFTIIRTYVYGMGRTTTSGHGPDSDLPE